MPSHIPNLKAIFEVVRDSETAYTLAREAFEAFTTVYDKLVRQTMWVKDENAQGILAKASGYSARVAMVLHALEQAVLFVGNEATSWSTDISANAVSVQLRSLNTATSRSSLCWA